MSFLIDGFVADKNSPRISKVNTRSTKFTLCVLLLAAACRPTADLSDSESSNVINEVSDNALPDAEHRALLDRYLHFQDPKAFEQLRRALVPFVTQWRWASDEMALPAPHYKKFFVGGRWLKKDGDPVNDYHHGFDAEGRIRVIDAYHTILVDYRDDLTEEIRFDHRSCAIYVKHFFHDAHGRVTRSIVIRSDGGGDSKYEWEDDRLIRIVSWQWRFDELIFPDEPWNEKREDSFRYDYEFSYAADGEVEQIVLVYPNTDEKYSEVEYRRKKKGETVKALTKELETRLLERIPERLKELKPASPVYAVFLTYCSSGWELPPMLIVATDADRQRAEAGYQWYLNELGVDFTSLEDPELSDRWGLYYQLMAEAENFQVCVKMLRSVARRLNDEGLSSWLKTTDDAVITAADSTDGIAIQEDLKHSLPDERFRRIQPSEFD